MKKKNKSAIYLAIGVTGIIVIFAALLQFTKPETLNDLFKKNIEENKNTSSSYAYNGFSFIKHNNAWFTRVQNAETSQLIEIATRYGPRDLVNVQVAGDIGNFKFQKGFYITFNPNMPNLGYVAFSNTELSTKMVQLFPGVVLRATCTENDQGGCRDVSLVTCANDTLTVIYFNQEPGPKLIRNANCLTVQGEGEDLIKATDRLILTWAGVMNQ